jgi:hypothetical protein
MERVPYFAYEYSAKKIRKLLCLFVKWKETNGQNNNLIGQNWNVEV